MWLPDIALFHALNAGAQSPGWVLALARFASDILPALMVSTAFLLLVPNRGAARRTGVQLLLSMALAWCVVSLFRNHLPFPRPARLPGRAGAHYVLEVGGATYEWLLDGFGWDSEIEYAGDLDRDGKPDLIVYVNGNNSGTWYVLLSGEEEAKTLGVDVRATRSWVVIWVSVLTSAAVTLAGSIAFVGLIVPHVLRPVVGSTHRSLTPAAALLGGSFAILCDVDRKSVV